MYKLNVDTDKIRLHLNEFKYKHNFELSTFNISHYHTSDELIPIMKNFLKKSNFITTYGSDEALTKLFENLQYDNISYIYPTYTFIEEYLKSANKIYLNIMDNEITYEMCTFNILPNKKTIIYICHPNNPTGHYITRDTLLKLLKLNVIVIIDQAYIEFTDLDRFDDIEDEKLIIVRTFSKAYGLAALRIGYIIAQPSILEKIKINTKFYNPCSKLALAHVTTTDYYTIKAQELIANKEKLIAKIKALGHTVKNTYGNFYLLMANEEDFLKRGILVRYKPNMPNFVRITASTEEENNLVLSVVSTIKPASYFPETIQNKILILREMLKRVIKTFEQHNILWFATGGTLLGAARYGKIIPHDDDIDLAVCHDISHIAPILGLKRNRTDRYWQLINGDSYLDIFEFKDGKCLDERFSVESPESEHCNPTFTEDELLPIIQLDFYDHKINVPAQYDKILTRAVGDYKKIGKYRINGSFVTYAI